MRFLGAVALVATMLGLMAPAAPAVDATSCMYVLGFKAFHEMMPETVGACVSDEVHNPRHGKTYQQTAGREGRGGLLVWRKSDNAVAYTDGYWTWVWGPEGMQRRLNTQRFAWERDGLTLEQLRNVEYRLPVFGNQPAAFRLADGKYEWTSPRGVVFFQDGAVAHEDLNNDGAADAVVLLAVNTGGSGIFEYAVAVVNRNGVPEQAGYEFLGDRVKVNSFSVADRRISVDMITQGPGEPLCCPTKQETRRLGILVPHAP